MMKLPLVDQWSADHLSGRRRQPIDQQRGRGGRAASAMASLLMVVVVVVVCSLFSAVGAADTKTTTTTKTPTTTATSTDAATASPATTAATTTTSGTATSAVIAPEATTTTTPTATSSSSSPSPSSSSSPPSSSPSRLLGVVRPEDPPARPELLPTATGQRKEEEASEREQDAMAMLWKERKLAEGRRLFGGEGVMFDDYEDVPPETFVQFARLALHHTGPLEDLSSFLKQIRGPPIPLPDADAGRSTTSLSSSSSSPHDGDGDDEGKKKGKDGNEGAAGVGAVTSGDDGGCKGEGSVGGGNGGVGGSDGGEQQQQQQQQNDDCERKPLTAALSAPHEKPSFRIAGVGFMLSPKTVQKHICRSARFLTMGRVWDGQPLFNVPSLEVVEKKMFTANENDVAVVTLEPLPRDEDADGVRTLVGVYDVPLDCFLQFLWMHRFENANIMTINVETLKENNNKNNNNKNNNSGLVPPYSVGSRIAAVVHTSPRHDSAPAFDVGFLRFYGIVEELALYPNERTLTTLLDEAAQQAVMAKCEKEEDRHFNRFKKERRWQLSLRYCFFNIDRQHLLQNILGWPIFKKGLEKRYGFSSLWQGGVNMSPSRAYIKAVLCGAMEFSTEVLDEVLDKTFVWRWVTLRQFLSSRRDRLTIPSSMTLFGPFSRAADCDEASLWKAILKPQRKQRLRRAFGLATTTHRDADNDKSLRQRWWRFFFKQVGRMFPKRK